MQVLGFTSVPDAGDKFLVAEEDRIARQIAERRQAWAATRSWPRPASGVSLEDWLEKSKVDSSNLILKGDGSGSVEALEDALLNIDVGAEVEMRIIDRGVGAITAERRQPRGCVRRGDHRLQRPAGRAGHAT